MAEVIQISTRINLRMNLKILTGKTHFVIIIVMIILQPFSNPLSGFVRNASCATPKQERNKSFDTTLDNKWHP